MAYSLNIDIFLDLVFIPSAFSMFLTAYYVSMSLNNNASARVGTHYSSNIMTYLFHLMHYIGEFLWPGLISWNVSEADP